MAREKHPSGRPIHRQVIKGRQIWRVPDSEAVTPRLRLKQLPSAIGFTANLEADDEGCDG